MPRLRTVDCSEPGITRRRRGRGFEYLDEAGDRVTDPELLSRLRELAIPPAWTAVWICRHPNGHLQAVGTDAAGRKQYLYHPVWRERRDAEKFERMLDFAHRLPTMRQVCETRLRRDDLDAQRVLACAIRLLDRGFFRIGTEDYAEENQTYGLATMRRSDVRLDGRIVTFDYVAKGGKRQVQSIVDDEVFEVIRILKRRRVGSTLLAFRQGRKWIEIRSTDINAAVKSILDGEFSAKDFRTWNATVLAAVAVAVSGGVAASKTGRKRAISRAVQEVAHYLGNTSAVCRSSYIDPRVFDRYRSGWTISGVLDELGKDAAFGDLSTQGLIEEAVIDLLEDRRSSPALEKVAVA
jgi:DNA topoisomerase I